MRNRKRQRKSRLDAAAASPPASVTFHAAATIAPGIEAQGDNPSRLPSFRVAAYTGGKLAVKNFAHPVVVDLKTAKFEREVLKANRNHDQMREVGHTTKQSIDHNGIAFEGVFSVEGKDTHEIVNAAKSGFPWDASIEASFPPAEFIAAGRTVSVNNQTFHGPVYVARHAVITGFAFLNNGADRNTNVAIAAQQSQRNQNMDPQLQQYIEAQGFSAEGLNDTQIQFFEAQFAQQSPPVKSDQVIQQLRSEAAAEQKRIQQVTSLCAQYNNPTIEIGEGDQKQTVSLAAHAIETAMPLTEVKLQAMLWDVQKKTGGSRGPAIHVANHNYDNITVQAIEASICRDHFNLREESITKNMPNAEQVMNLAASKQIRGITLHGLMHRICAAAGVHAGSMKEKENIEAAFKASQSLQASGTTTLGLSNLMENTLNKSLLDSFEVNMGVWDQIAATTTVTDFKALSRVRLTADGGFRRVGKDGQLKHMSMVDSKRTNQAETFGAIMTLTRKDIINDDLSGLAKSSGMLGRAAAVSLNEEVFITLLSNTGSFFSAGNNNYLDGSGTPLTFSYLPTVRQAFRDRVDSNSKPITVGPSLLLVGTALESMASQLYSDEYFGISDTATGGKRKGEQVRNEFRGLYRPVVTPYLNNTDIKDSTGASIPNQSATVYFLLADPNVIPIIEVCFLNGQRTPTAETEDMSFEKLGIQYRSYFDFGVAYGDEEGGIMVKGAA